MRFDLIPDFQVIYLAIGHIFGGLTILGVYMYRFSSRETEPPKKNSF